MTDLRVDRTGPHRCTGHSSRGAPVLVGAGDVDGVFAPGEQACTVGRTLKAGTEVSLGVADAGS